MEAYADVGRRIFELRKKSKLTREQLAEKADISVQFLADIEKGRKNMSVTTLRKLSSALLVTTDHIVYGRNETPSQDSELLYLCSAVPPEYQSHAAKLLRVFLEALTEKSEKCE